MISLHGGGSPAAMKQEIWRNYPVGNKVELVERLLERGVLARPDDARDHGATASRASAATGGCTAPGQAVMVDLPGVDQALSPRCRHRKVSPSKSAASA